MICHQEKKPKIRKAVPHSVICHPTVARWELKHRTTKKKGWVSETSQAFSSALPVYKICSGFGSPSSYHWSYSNQEMYWLWVIRPLPGLVLSTVKECEQSIIEIVCACVHLWRYPLAADAPPPCTLHQARWTPHCSPRRWLHGVHEQNSLWNMLPNMANWTTSPTSPSSGGRSLHTLTAALTTRTVRHRKTVIRC